MLERSSTTFRTGDGIFAVGSQVDHYSLRIYGLRLWELLLEGSAYKWKRWT